MRQKPFHSKTKLFFQTKIDLWGHNPKIYFSKFNKKKWNFLKFSQPSLSQYSFRFNLNFSDSILWRRYNYKNNLYLKKMLRLKSGRLKNKEFYNLFKKSSDYRTLISKLGSRLDVSIHNILFPISIFFLRQKIIHGKVLLNGNIIRNPNQRLKKFDIISLDLTNFNPKLYLFQDLGELVSHLDYIKNSLFEFADFGNLTEESQKNFIQNFINILKEDNENLYVEYCTESINNSLLFNKENPYNGSNESKKIFKLEKFIDFLNKRYLRKKILYHINMRKVSLKHQYSINDEVANYEKSLGFLNNKINSSNFEFSYSGNHLDIVFLGFENNKVDITSSKKYLLHYLY